MHFLRNAPCSITLALTLGLAVTSVRADSPTARNGKTTPSPSHQAVSRQVSTHDAAQAVSGLDVADGLVATLFASEPMMSSPTNMDVDARGRVWTCDVVNYRHFANQNNPYRKKGDRILILEDTNHNGKADKVTVFYQGQDIDGAHGVCVLGNRVIVSAGNNVFVLTDTDGDDHADKKEVLFTGFIGPTGKQHDHGIHAIVFGPDGRLYFNIGNQPRRVLDHDGKSIVDRDGNLVEANRKPYQGGMVFRCDPDGANFETLAWNFRNDWEISVDSFGTLWQSDNDDDGNRGVRINYVMEFGNYGYRDELTGAGWRALRTGWNADVSKRHWHLNDPGAVPNLLQTGSGSPTGICVYEGGLLPKRFRNQLLHCDPGPSIVRSYAVTKDGAGYKARINNILDGTRDNWFRPTDVCTAPDGSLFIADWYDPAVGGHRMGDTDRGRVFHVTVPNTPYRVPKIDITTPNGAVKALQSPNLATRYLAWTALHAMGKSAESALQTLFKQGSNPRFRARALWLLGRIDGRGRHYVDAALGDQNADIRITGLRLARQLRLPIIPVVGTLVHDSSPAVRRECAIALRHVPSAGAAELWAELALQHDGKDRWFLEALGIGANRQWDAFLSVWLKKVGNRWNSPAGRDIIWRSRARVTSNYLARILTDASTPTARLPRYLRAFDFQTGPAKKTALHRLAFKPIPGETSRTAFIAAEAINRIKGFDIRSKPESRATLNRLLDATRGTRQFVRLAAKFNVRDRFPEVLTIAQQKSDQQAGVEAIQLLLSIRKFSGIQKALDGNNIEVTEKTIAAMGNSADPRIVRLLLPIINDSARSIRIRRAAVRAAGRPRNGGLALVVLAKAGKIDARLKPAAASTLYASHWNDIKRDAAKLFPLPPSRNNKPLPPIALLVERHGNPVKGRILFASIGTCAKCHVINGFGKEIGPNLSEIGKKLSRQAMYQSILFPSSAISHNYETYNILLESGNVVSGLIISRTDQSVSIKSADAIVRTFKTADIEEIQKQTVSLMPADIQKLLTAEELVDIVEYLITLKKAVIQKTTATP